MQIVKKTNFVTLAFLMLPLFFLLSFAFNIVDGKSLLSRVIPFVCLVALFFFRKETTTIWKEKLFKPFFISSILVCLCFLVFHLLRGDSFSLSRTILISLLYLVFLPWRCIPANWFYYLFSFGGIFSGLTSLYEVYFLDIYRAGVAVNPIPYALFAANLSTICIYFFFKKNSKTLSVFLFLGFIFSITSLVLSGSRGVIFLLPFIFPILFFLTKKSKFIGIIKFFFVLFLSISIIYVIFEKPIDNRIDITIKQVHEVQEGNLNNSIGLRFILWQHGVEVFKDNWLVGVGTNYFKEFSLDYTKSGGMSHLHNQFIDSLARYGVTGSFFILFWLFSVLIRIKNNKLSLKLNPILTSMLLLYLLAGLTDVPLHHTHLIYFYMIIAGVLLYLESTEEKEA